MNRQSGIVIGPILFVVALLAVLATALAAGTGVFSGDTSAVKAKAQAAAILEYADVVQTGVNRVMSRGCLDTQISFYTDALAPYYNNPNAPSDKSCHVFYPEGGGIIRQGLPVGAATVTTWPPVYSFSQGKYGFSGSNVIAGTTCCQIMMYAYGLSRDVCMAINELTGIVPQSGEPPSSGNPGTSHFVGNFNIWTLNVPGNWGKRRGCVYITHNDADGNHSAVGTYYFFNILTQR